MLMRFRNRLLDTAMQFVPMLCSVEGDPPDNSGGGGGGGGNPPPAKRQSDLPPSKFDEAPPKGQEVFSREYVEELRSENKSWRMKVVTERTARESAEAAFEAGKKDFDTKTKAIETDAAGKVTVAQKAADDRVIRAELRAVATKAGMIDLDGLKLADTSALKLKEDGTVDGADALMTALKTAKPYLFGTGKGTSNAGDPPPPKDQKKKSALELTPAEFAQSMRDIDAGKIPA
jgi:hypothetical protein